MVSKPKIGEIRFATHQGKRVQVCWLIDEFGTFRWCCRNAVVWYGRDALTDFSAPIVDPGPEIIEPKPKKGARRGKTKK